MGCAISYLDSLPVRLILCAYRSHLTKFLKNNVEAGEYFRRLNKNGSGHRNKPKEFSVVAREFPALWCAINSSLDFPLRFITLVSLTSARTHTRRWIQHSIGALESWRVSSWGKENIQGFLTELIVSQWKHLDWNKLKLDFFKLSFLLQMALGRFPYPTVRGLIYGGCLKRVRWFLTVFLQESLKCD